MCKGFIRENTCVKENRNILREDGKAFRPQSKSEYKRKGEKAGGRGPRLSHDL